MMLNVKAILVKNIKLDRQAEFIMPDQLISVYNFINPDRRYLLINGQILQNQNRTNQKKLNQGGGGGEKTTIIYKIHVVNIKSVGELSSKILMNFNNHLQLI